MSDDVETLRAARRQSRPELVKGRVRTVGKRDYGKYGLKDARTGHKVMGFGNRGVTASLAEIERFLNGDEDALWEASLKAGKARKRALSWLR